MKTGAIIKYAFALAIILCLTPGCARYPDSSVTPPSASGKQLVITLKVRGSIQPIDGALRHYYFIAIDNDNDDATGPWAVIGPPYGGTGWVTSAQAASSIGMTSYVQYDATHPSGLVYKALPGSYFLNVSSPSALISSQVTDGGQTLQVVVDFSQIATSTISASAITNLNVNIITTNELAIDPASLYLDRESDGIGPTGQSYVNVDATIPNQLYSGYDTDDVGILDGDIDIEYWSIEVQETN